MTDNSQQVALVSRRASRSTPSARTVPMKPIGTPEDVTAGVVLFAGEGTAFITGRTLSVSGSLTMA